MLRNILIASALTCLLLAACGDDASTTADSGLVAADGRINDAPPIDGPINCPNPLDCATWLEAYEREIVSKLSGNEEISVGVTLAARSTVEQRNAARSYIYAELLAHGLDAQIHNYGGGANVYAELPATESPSTVIVMGAHFDGVPNGPAAADDGTGVALVLSAARYFASLESRGDTLIFVLFDQEEIGLVGSANFAEKLDAETTIVSAMHNFDMISYDGDGDGAIELWSPAPALEQLYRDAAAEFDAPVMVVDFSSSDHASFIDYGYDAVGVGEEFVSGDHTPHYHTPQDSYDKVDFAYLLKVTQLAFTAVTHSME